MVVQSIYYFLMSGNGRGNINNKYKEFGFSRLSQTAIFSFSHGQCDFLVRVRGGVIFGVNEIREMKNVSNTSVSILVMTRNKNQQDSELFKAD